MKDADSIINQLMQTELKDKYVIDDIPIQDPGPLHSAIAFVKPLTGPETDKRFVVKVQQYEPMNLREAYGLWIKSHFPEAIKIKSPRLIEPKKPPEPKEPAGSYCVQELIIGTPLDTMIKRIPEFFDEQYGKWLAEQFFPTHEDIRLSLKDKTLDRRYDFYPKTEVPTLKLIPSTAPQKGQKSAPSPAPNPDAALISSVVERNDFADFLSILSAPSLGFYKGDWRLSKILYNAEISATEFYSLDYGHSHVMPKQYDADKRFAIRVAPFNTILKALGAARTERMITAFIAAAKNNIAHNK